MHYQVRTPFLRLFLRLFGNASLQLLPLELSNLASLLNFAWNLLLVSLVSSLRTFLQSAWLVSDLADPRVVAAFAEKPLFALIYRLSYNFFHQAAFAINQLYFYYLSLNTSQTPSLISLLDALRPELFTCPKRSKNFFLHVFALLQVAYFVTMAQMVVGLLAKSQYSILALFYVGFFPLNLNANMPFFLTFYYKVATSVRLHEITESYARAKNDTNLLNIRLVEQEVARLATLNVALGRLLSLPLLVALVPYLSEILIFVSCLWGVKGFSELNLYLVQFVWQAIYLAVLERRISRQLKALSALIKEKVEQQQQRKRSNYQFSLILGKSTTPASLSNSAETCLPPEMAFSVIALLDIYGKQMRLRLFDDLCTLNWAFFLNLFLLLLNLIALMVQTTPTMAEHAKSSS